MGERTLASFLDTEQNNGSRYKIGLLLVPDAATGRFLHCRGGKDCVIKSRGTALEKQR